MDAELVFKVVGVLTAVVAAGFGAFKTYMDFSQVQRGRLRDEYKFAKDFFLDAKDEGGMHPFLKEKGLQAIAGTTSINPVEIQYLLTLKGAPQAIKNYVFGRKYLQHLEGWGNLQVAYKDKYSSKRYRTALKGWYLFWYGLFVFAAGSPYVFSGYIPGGAGMSPGLLLLTVVFFSPYAFLALRAGVRISHAEHLVEHQEAHTQAIIVADQGRLLEEPGGRRRA